MLLDESSSVLVDDHLSGLLHLLAFLDEFFVLDVIGEESSGFGDDCGGLLVLSDLLLELLVLFSSGGVKLVKVSLVSLDFGLLLGNQVLEDLSLRIELSLESGFELDLLSV